MPGMGPVVRTSPTTGEVAECKIVGFMTDLYDWDYGILDETIVDGGTVFVPAADIHFSAIQAAHPTIAAGVPDAGKIFSVKVLLDNHIASIEENYVFLP